MTSKTYFLIFLIASLLFSLFACKEKRKVALDDQFKLNEEQLSVPNFDSLPPLNTIQKQAFETLNKLQIHSRNHFFSTFPGSIQACPLADTSFDITAQELHDAIQFLFKTQKTINPPQHLTDWITKAVQATNLYQVEQCFQGKKNQEASTKPAKIGTWMIRNVLSRRDIIIEW